MLAEETLHVGSHETMSLSSLSESSFRFSIRKNMYSGSSKKEREANESYFQHTKSFYALFLELNSWLRIGRNSASFQTSSLHPSVSEKDCRYEITNIETIKDPPSIHNICPIAPEDKQCHLIAQCPGKVGLGM